MIARHRPTTVEARQFDGTMASFEAIHDWMGAIDSDANSGYSGSEAEGNLSFSVRCRARRQVTAVRARDVVLHRFVGGCPMFCVLTAADFAELYDVV